MMHSNEINPTIRLPRDHADRLIRGISSGSHELYRLLRDFVNARSSRCHGEEHPLTPIGGVIGCKQFSWLREVGCGLSSAFEYGGPCCDRCGAGVWVVPGAHRQNARPVPVGDQPRDQAQCGRRRVLQGRGGGAHGRTPTRPSQGARHRCRPCSAVPCRVRPRPGPNAPPDQRAPQGPERVAGVARHVLAPQQPMGARSATRRSTRGSTRHPGGGTS